MPRAKPLPPRSISSLRRLPDPVPGTSSPLPPCRGDRHAVSLAALPRGSGTPAPREGSQRHLRLTRPTSPQARVGNRRRASGPDIPPLGRLLPPTPPQSSETRVGRGSLRPGAAPGMSQATQDRLRASGRRLGHARHREAGQWLQAGSILGTAPLPASHCPGGAATPPGAMDGARLRVLSPLAGSVAVGRCWETLECHLHHEPKPAPNLCRSARSNSDFPVLPVWDASLHDGTEFPLIWSSSHQLLARTRADCPAPGSASAKPTNTQKRAGSQQAGAAPPVGSSRLQGRVRPCHPHP